MGDLGAVSSIVSFECTLSPATPAWLVATTRTSYVSPWLSIRTTGVGSDTDGSSKALALASHKALAFPLVPCNEMRYDRTPLQASEKPLHRTVSCALVAAKTTASPNSSSTPIVPPRGLEQHSFAPSDVTVCCSPAQFVARTVKK